MKETRQLQYLSNHNKGLPTTKIYVNSKYNKNSKRNKMFHTYWRSSRPGIKATRNKFNLEETITSTFEEVITEAVRRSLGGDDEVTFVKGVVVGYGKSKNRVKEGNGVRYLLYASYSNEHGHKEYKVYLKHGLGSGAINAIRDVSARSWIQVAR